MATTVARLLVWAFCMACLVYTGATGDILEDHVSEHFTAWYFVDWGHPRGVMYLTAAWIECPTGEVLTRIRFEQRPLIDKSAHFRYVYGCVYAGKEDMVYETIKNDLTPFRDEIDSGLGTINYLDRQALICPKSSGINVFMTAVAMELDLETEMLRYIYKCGKVDLGTESLCEERSTPKHQTKDFFLLNLEYLGIQCRPDEGLTKFQLRVEHEPGLLLWYEYTCCRQGYGFLGRPSPRFTSKD